MIMFPEYREYGEDHQVMPREKPIGENEPRYPGDGAESDGGEL